VNCAAIPSELLKASSSGTRKGLTNAIRTRIGRFELANGGTVFLDEIGDMNPPCRANCCGCCRSGSSSGGSSEEHQDGHPHHIAATHQDLKMAVAQKKFRKICTTV
jgi:transcriptional regulator with GAF, ATPase, and Fis domain